MKKYTVAIDSGAELDLDDITAFIADHDSIEHALDIATGIERSLAALEAFPHRGVHPRELLDFGNRDFREIHFKPYRIFYRVIDRHVIVVLIADGRRDMRKLLARRLLNA